MFVILLYILIAFNVLLNVFVAIYIMFRCVFSRCTIRDYGIMLRLAMSCFAMSLVLRYVMFRCDMLRCPEFPGTKRGGGPWNKG